MSIWGTILGGAAGFALGGPIGALLGGMAGRAYDQAKDPALQGHTRHIPSTTGLVGGSGGAEVDITLTSAIFDHSQLELASGDNTIATPSTAHGLLFIPPVATPATILITGVT